MEKENKNLKKINKKADCYHFFFCGGGGEVHKQLGGLFFIFKYIFLRDNVLKEVQKG